MCVMLDFQGAMSGSGDHNPGSKSPPGEAPAAESDLLPPDEEPTVTDGGPAAVPPNDTIKDSTGLASAEAAGEDHTVVEGGPPGGLQWEAEFDAKEVLEQVNTAIQDVSARYPQDPPAPARKRPTRRGMGEEAPPPVAPEAPLAPPPGALPVTPPETPLEPPPPLSSSSPVDPMAETLAPMNPRLAEDAPTVPPDLQSPAPRPAPSPVAPEPSAPAVSAPKLQKSKPKRTRRSSRRGPSILLLAVLWVVALASVTVAVVLYVTR
jgi:hypothetical protein